MADGVAVLGLQVDASGALVELKKFDDATKKVGDTSVKTGAALDANTVRLEAQRAAYAQTAAQMTAATRITEAQAVANQQAAAASVDSVISAKSLAAAWAAEATTETAATAATIAHRNALVATRIAAVAGAGGVSLLQTAITALGGPVGVAVLGFTALMFIIDKVRDAHAKAAKEAKEHARELEQLTDAQLSNTIAVLESQRAALQQKRDAAGENGNLFGVLALDDALSKLKPRLAENVAQLQKNRSEAKAGESAVGALAASLADAEATVRAYARGGDDAAKAYKLAAGAWVVSAGGARTLEAALRDGDQVAKELIGRATQQVAAEKRLQQARDASTKAQKDAAEAARARADAERATLGILQQAESEGKVAKSQEIAQVGVDAVAKLDAELDRRKRIGEEKAKQFLSAQKEIDAVAFQVSLLGKSRAEQEKLTDAENLRIAKSKGFTDEQAKQIVALQRQLRLNQDWVASFTEVLGVVQLIAAGFGAVGREIAKAASGAQSIVAGLNASKNATTTQQQVAAAGTIAGGVFTLVDALNSLNKSAEKAAQKAKDLSDAYVKQFEAARKLVDVRTDSSSAIGTDTASLNDAAGRAFGAAIKAAVKAKDNAAIGAALLAYQQALDDIATFAADRAKDIAAQQKKLEGFTKDNDVLALRIQGRNDEADAMQVQIEIERKYEEAVDLYGKTAETARYKTLLLAQATDEAAKAAIRKAEAERRSITDLTNGARAFTDPRGAGQAAFEETQRRRLSDAIERNASAAELAAINLYNLAEAADRAAQIAEQDLRTQESLIARVLGTLGNDRATQDFVTGANQRQEIADSIRNGMSPTNLAFLQFTQRVENSYTQMQRAIEDGTKAIQDRAKNEIAAIDVLIEVTQSVAKQQIAAIDAQIKETQTLAKATAKAYDEQIRAIREQTKAQLDAIDVQIEAARGALDAANATVNALDKQVQTNLKVVEALQQFSNSIKLGDLSTLSPEGKLAEARRQFEALASAAQGGNADAATQLPGAAQALLQASRAFNASGPGFVNDFNRVNDIIAQLTQQFGATLPIDQQQLEAARQSVTALQATVDALGKQKDTISKASDAQIAVLQKAKDKAAEDAQRVIDKLQENKQKIQDDTAATIAKLEETKTAIQDAAQRQIEQLVRVESEAHQARIRQDEYWQQFLGLGAFNPTGNGPETLPGDGTSTPVVTPILQSQLAAQEENTRVLGEKIDGLTAVMNRLLTVAATANDEEVGATVQTTAAVQNVAQQIRQLGQALVARSR